MRNTGAISRRITNNKTKIALGYRRGERSGMKVGSGKEREKGELEGLEMAGGKKGVKGE